jgi:hypothetical protein
VVELYEANLDSVVILDRLRAQGEIHGARTALAGFVRNNQTLPEAANLVGWALQYLADRAVEMGRSAPFSL